MKFLALGATILSFFSLAVSAEGDAVENPITMLTSEQFNRDVFDPTSKKMKHSNPWFIKFMAPWCGHCKRLAPTMQKLFNEHSDKVNWAKVDCTDKEHNRDLCTEMFNVKGYPTLLFMVDGKFLTYKKARNEEEILKWATEGYKEELDDAEPIPLMLTGFAREMREYEREFNVHFRAGVRHFVRDSVKYGVMSEDTGKWILDQKEKTLKPYFFGLVAVILSFLIGFICVCCCGSSKKKVSEDSSAPRPKKGSEKREKIE